MKEKIILVLKGFILGIANIIPGVSGGTLAITLGIYEQLIEVISHLLSNLKKNFEFLIPIGIGAVLSILTLSKVISYALDKVPIPTTLFFIGLIVGGVPIIFKKVKDSKKTSKNITAFLITFTLVMIMTFISGENVASVANINPLTMIILFLVGVIAAATMVIPGVSGSFVLMLIGYYEPIIKTISNLTKFNLIGHNLMILIPFGLGVVIGIVLIAKLIEYLLKKYESLTYYAIIGFITSSIISLFISLSAYKFNISSVVVGIILFIIGSLIGYKLGDS